MTRWGLIVEGHGEVRALPVLLRRLVPASRLHEVEIVSPMRQPRSTIVAEGALERAVGFMRSKTGPDGVVMVLLDADDDLPCELGPRLLARCRDTVGDIPLSVVLAKIEFESWFLGSLESLRGTRGIREDASSPDAPEEIRGAKEFLTRQMEGSRAYRPTVDQAALAAQFDIGAARGRCPSLDKFMRDVESLLGAAVTT